MRPYRNEVDALRERRDALGAELDSLRGEAEKLTEIRARAAAIAGELADVDDKLRGVKRALPLLDRITVATPCSAVWDKMVGDDRVRFCGGCEKNVYNLSAMTREEAEALLQETNAGVCVRFYQRADGKVMTQDCAVGVQQKRRRQRAFGIVAAGAMAAGAVAAVLNAKQGGARVVKSTEEMLPPVTSDMKLPPEPSVQDTPPVPMMGAPAIPQQHLMGKPQIKHR
jgi:hypothetical protein